jgi:hypothetical protein
MTVFCCECGTLDVCVSAAGNAHEEILNLSCSRSFPDRRPDKNDACWQGYARLPR